jgi:hypothetical protein
MTNQIQTIESQEIINPGCFTDYANENPEKPRDQLLGEYSSRVHEYKLKLLGEYSLSGNAGHQMTDSIGRNL